MAPVTTTSFIDLAIEERVLVTFLGFALLSCLGYLITKAKIAGFLNNPLPSLAIRLRICYEEVSGLFSEARCMIIVGYGYDHAGNVIA